MYIQRCATNADCRLADRRPADLQTYRLADLRKKISICLNTGREESVGNDDVMKTENFEGTGQVDFVTFIVHSYFDTLLRYLLSVTFCGAVGSVKVMDQKTLVKRR